MLPSKQTASPWHPDPAGKKTIASDRTDRCSAWLPALPVLQEAGFRRIPHYGSFCIPAVLQTDQSVPDSDFRRCGSRKDPAYNQKDKPPGVQRPLSPEFQAHLVWITHTGSSAEATAVPDLDNPPGTTLLPAGQSMYQGTVLSDPVEEA